MTWPTTISVTAPYQKTYGLATPSSTRYAAVPHRFQPTPNGSEASAPLTLSWNAVAGANSYAILFWADGETPQIAAQGKLAADSTGFELVGRELLAGGEQRHREREVEARPRLSHVRGREVGRQSLERELEARVEDGRPDPLSRLAHGRVRKAHDPEAGQTRADVDLDRDFTAVDAVEGEGGDLCEHTANLRGGRRRRCNERNNFATGL